MPIHQTIYERLKDIARNKNITYYSEIAPLADLDMASEVGRIKIAQILDDINGYENDNARPMLSAVVILKEHNLPGAGFFECARGLGEYHGSSDEKERLMFWIRELEKVHNYWQSHT